MLKNLNKIFVLLFAVSLSAAFIWYQSGEADDELADSVQIFDQSDALVAQLTKVVAPDTIKVSRDSLRKIYRIMWTSKSSMMSPPKTVYVWDSVIRSATDAIMLDYMDSLVFQKH
ncbi:MAG: hypothetical protein EP332_10265 [Bacteroidetes bacterium]|nr:MAG: hypothetical protein EP332_10265 [Bacteroidota bacterium]